MINIKAGYIQKANKERGITLVALIVTIIILVILAAVTIDQVFDLKIIETAINGTQNYTEAQIQEKEDLDEMSKKVADAVKKTEIVEIKYNIGKEIKELEKANNRNITDEELKEILEKYGTLSEDGEKIEDKILTTNKGSYNLKVSDILKGPVEDVPDKPVEPDKPKVAYLVDTVEIGDYVDIGIDYENKQVFTGISGGEITEALTGWRVLSKSGSGASGTVKLVSAGCPMTYLLNRDVINESIYKLEDLYTTISMETDNIPGFKENGFSDNNLQNIFTKEKYIDISKGIHALGVGTHYPGQAGAIATKYEPLNELEELYIEITGQVENTFERMFESAMNTARLKNVAGDRWKQKYSNMIDIGQSYFLGGATNSEYNLWGIRFDGSFRNVQNETRGIRPVVTLQSGVRIKEGNTGDGTSSSSAYKLAE